MSALIVGVSILFQFAAALLSLRLIRLTGRWRVWISFAIALTLMGVRRSITLYRALSGDSAITPDLTAELVALCISVLMLVGVILIRPVFKKLETTNRTLLFKQFSIDNAHAAIYWLDSEFCIADLNLATCKMLGYTREQLLGMHISEIDQQFPIADWRAWKARENQTFDSHHQTRDGHLLPVEVTASYFGLDNKEAICVFVSDITERSQIHQSLTRLTEQLSKNQEVLFALAREDLSDLETSYEHIVKTDSEQLNVSRVSVWLFNESHTEIHCKCLYSEGVKADPSPAIFSDSEIPRYFEALEHCAAISANDAHNDPRTSEFSQTYLRPNGISSMMDVPILLQGKTIGIVCHEHVGPIREWTQQDEDFATSIADMCALSLQIAERRQAEDQLRKLSRAVEASSSVVVITNLEGHLEYVNPKFTEITGYSRDEALGQNVNLLKSGETPESVYAELWKTVLAGGVWKGEMNNRKKDGSLYRDRASIAGVKDEKGVITHFIAIQDDITVEYELTEKLVHQASHDALTGLFNRNEFEQRTKVLLALARKDRSQHALCFMDLDQFKVVNDSCGHTAGDEMLRQIGSLLTDTVRRGDTLARLGGDEFAVLMEHCSIEDAQRIAGSLQHVIQEFRFSWEGRSFQVGVSLGLVPITAATASPGELLRDADAACYMAKDLGRNRIHTFHPEDQELARRSGEMQWVNRLNQALDENLFCLYAQTIEALDGGSNKHYELLIRMIGGGGRIIQPAAFLPAAERYDLASKIDHWVVENSFALLVNNPRHLQQIDFCSINLSGQSLTEESFLDFAIAQLEKSGIQGEKICFEITETAAISNLSMATNFITRLKALGCRFALDDFGSGVSSFGYLKNLPVDFLKIDGIFVKDIAENPIDHAMVKSINEIGHVMGMQTIAEFVENDTIKDLLKVLQVDYAQGYGIGKPRPFSEFLEQPLA